MKGGPSEGAYWIDAAGEELQRLLEMRDELASTKPLLHLTVYPRRMRENGDEPAVLHRFLAGLGYVPELRDETPDVEHWLYQHPDGILP